MSLRDYGQYGRLVERISGAIQQGNVSHAYIIEGDSCIDKEKFARDFTKAVLCEEAPGFGCDGCVTCRKIDHDNYEDLYFARADELSLKDAEIAALQEKLKNRPTGGARNIAIIEGTDTMTARAQNRLLKTLEEPNPGTILFLLSENTENLLPTINSRCITYRLGNYVSERTEIDLSLAEEMMDMLIGRAYFCDVKAKLDKKIKDRKDGFLLLDGLERLFRQYLTGQRQASLRKDKLVLYINYVEEARRDLLANVNYKYAIRNLMLKIGG